MAPSELMPVAAIDVVGDLSEQVQYITEFSAAVVAGSAHPAEAARFLDFLAASQNAAVIREPELEPVQAKKEIGRNVINH